ncbi:MAG: LapA family protein [Pseudomonadota bacterium]
MRAIKLGLVIVIGLAAMMIIAANWTPVDLNLLPTAMGLAGLSYPQVPLALIIVAAVLAGFVLAQLLELLKGGSMRRRLDQKTREISRLRQENARLTEKTGDEDEDLQQLLAS